MDNFWDFLGGIIKALIVFVGSYLIIALLLVGLILCIALK